jgi:hypothetical protein
MASGTVKAEPVYKRLEAQGENYKLSMLAKTIRSTNKACQKITKYRFVGADTSGMPVML